MGNRVRLGDRLQVVFVPAKWGVQTQEPINGRRAFATDKGPTPQAFDRWEVMVVGMNPTRTIYIVEPLNLVEAADGLSEELKPHLPFYHEFIRDAEARLSALLSNVGSLEADDEANALDEILGNCLLPPAYIAAASNRYHDARASAAAS
jgi:hypothetical protein